MMQNMRQQKVWVVFSDQTDIRWLKILKRGYRHCFVLIHDGMRWITLDPLSHRMEVVAHDTPHDFDLPSWLSGQGFVVVRSRINEDDRPTPAPLMPFTCVEAVKRFLGIRSRFIITPWQLCEYLQRPAKLPARDFHCLPRGGFSWEV